MRNRVGIPLLVVIVGFLIAIAYYERKAEPVDAAPVVPRKQAASAEEAIEAPHGFSQANWTVDTVADDGSRSQDASERPAQRKEPTWAGSEIILPVK